MPYARFDYDFLDRYPKYFTKKYPSYEEFREDYVGKKEKFGSKEFSNSNHNEFWRIVVDQTDKCTVKYEKRLVKGLFERCTS